MTKTHIGITALSITLLASLVANVIQFTAREYVGEVVNESDEMTTDPLLIADQVQFRSGATLDVPEGYYAILEDSGGQSVHLVRESSEGLYFFDAVATSSVGINELGTPTDADWMGFTDVPSPRYAEISIDTFGDRSWRVIATTNNETIYRTIGADNRFAFGGGQVGYEVRINTLDNRWITLGESVLRGFAFPEDQEIVYSWATPSGWDYPEINSGIFGQDEGSNWMRYYTDETRTFSFAFPYTQISDLESKRFAVHVLPAETILIDEQGCYVPYPSGMEPGQKVEIDGYALCLTEFSEGEGGPYVTHYYSLPSMDGYLMLSATAMQNSQCDSYTIQSEVENCVSTNMAARQASLDWLNGIVETIQLN